MGASSAFNTQVRALHVVQEELVDSYDRLEDAVEDFAERSERAFLIKTQMQELSDFETALETGGSINRED